MTGFGGSSLSIVAALVLGIARPAVATDHTLERYLFTGYMPTFQSGDSVPKDGVFALKLAPVATYTCGPLEGPTNFKYAGDVTLEALPAGRYAIILSQEAQLVAVQQRPFAPVPIFQGGSEAGLGLAGNASSTITSVGGPVTLQFSGAPTHLMSVAVFPLPD